MPTIDFYYDLRSPYAYFAWKRRSILEKVGASIRPLPVSIDVLLNLQANRKPWAEYVDPLAPPKRAHLMADIPRMAQYWGIPIGGPFTFKPTSKLAMCALTMMLSSQRAPVPIIDSFFEMLWAKARNIDEPEVFRDLIGMMKIPMMTEADYNTALDTLTQNTIDAFASGIFGVPSFRYSGQVYFGADRMDVLAAALSEST